MVFEFFDMGWVIFGNLNLGIIGGVLVINLFGLRWFVVGGLCDYFLGVKGVSGWGEFFKVGGCVVKNVMGYDMCKFFVGFYGMFVVMIEVIVKVFLVLEIFLFLVVIGLD